MITKEGYSKTISKSELKRLAIQKRHKYEEQIPDKPKKARLGLEEEYGSRTREKQARKREQTKR